MFDRVVYMKDEDVRRVVLTEIASRTFNNPKHEIESLNSGAFASVYEHADDTRIYKLGYGNSNGGYLTYLRSIEGKDNPHFPRIFHKELYIDKSSGDSYFLIEMEKLLDSSEVTDGAENLPEKYGNMRYIHFASELQNHVYSNAARKLFFLFEMPKTWYEAAEVVRAAKYSRNEDTTWDLNWSNLMFRPVSLDVVITDPLT
jgi:hypothetical protein